MDLDNRIGDSLRTDYFLLRTEFTPTQLDYLSRTRAFVEQEVLPEINGYWERAEFPRPLIEKLGKIGIVARLRAVDPAALSDTRAAFKLDTTAIGLDPDDVFWPDEHTTYTATR